MALLLHIQPLLTQQPILFQGPCPHGLVDGSQRGATLSLFAGRSCSQGEWARRRESLTGALFHPQGLGKAAMLSESKPSSLIKKRQISHISSPLADFGLPDLCAQWCFLFHGYYGALSLFFSFSPSAVPSASACSGLCFTSSSPFT